MNIHYRIQNGAVVSFDVRRANGQT
jgi:hypothetical protein